MHFMRNIAAGLVLLVTTNAFGQSTTKPFPEGCQAPSQQELQRGSPSRRGGDADLSRCNGVLIPPASGDEGLEQPAPSTGTLRVIPPSKAPGQQHNLPEPQ
ncbi:putative secreted protein (plasmid) [Rhizobium favelukesii]|uniref:Secreted protein n=1 Tax=Rhizobium favelukesii TaxID=348824 RepID=W6RNQ9_9HYPH|nr:putative secreted protein [Rhizobium favelukesii]